MTTIDRRIVPLLAAFALAACSAPASTGASAPAGTLSSAATTGPASSSATSTPPTSPSSATAATSTSTAPASPSPSPTGKPVALQMPGDDHATAIACAPAAGTCYLASYGGLLYQYSHGVWQPYATNSDVHVTALSCADAEHCFGIGGHDGWDFDLSSGGTTTNYLYERNSGLSAVACGSNHVCTVVDHGGGASVTNRARGWFDHFVRVTAAPDSGDPLVAALTGLSCDSTRTLCVATTSQGRAYARHGNGRWVISPLLAPGQLSNSDPAFAGPNTVACPTSRWCIAVDRFGQAYTYSDGRWSSATQVAEGIRAVACRGEADCVAVGGRGSAGTAVGFAQVLDGRTWAPAIVVDTRGWLRGVGCLKPGEPCMAFDSDGRITPVG